jgi:hypothetical protein
MARTEGQWKKGTASVQPIADLPILLQNDYLNFGGVVPGDLGYGFRDNNGVIEYKNEDGNWMPFGGDVALTDTFGITVDGAGTVLTTGSKGFRYIEQDCTITGWNVIADQTGSVIFDVKRAGVSIVGTEKPNLYSQQYNSDTSLSTWTTSLSAGDIIEFVIDSASIVTRATLTVLVTKN